VSLARGRSSLPLAGGSALSLDNLTVVPKAMLSERITTLSPQRLEEVCRALALAAGCRT